MTEQDKQRIEKEAREHFDKIGRPDDGNEMRAWIQGATREHERMAELLKETVEALQLARNILHQKYNYTALEHFDNIIEKAKGKSQ